MEVTNLGSEQMGVTPQTNHAFRESKYSILTRIWSAVSDWAREFIGTTVSIPTASTMLRIKFERAAYSKFKWQRVEKANLCFTRLRKYVKNRRNKICISINKFYVLDATILPEE